ncbi:MAG: 3-deoxy-manno-octulosonate cytidylyltransferase [Phycisphaeraceae bacterium]|nr:MAG: 3-deoxy-manno-octulosonate cytidylyltransferase [Phycisphaeraceae bacterium]
MPDVVVIIPARYESTRFPGKPLANATGRPMIQHVHDAAAASSAVSRVVIATDDERIATAVRGFGGEALLTSPEHPNGTSRLAEAADILKLSDDSIVVNAQGDEPELNPALINAAVDVLLGAAATGRDAPMATIASPFAPDENPADPNIVKVVMRCDGSALYFSRALIPHTVFGDGSAGDAAAQPLKHVGLYAYRREFLREYIALEPTPLEQAERLEQLRALEHGREIVVAVMDVRHHGIDTPAQYEAFVARWKARAAATGR